ncbi:hypothetical protein M752DRAFT_77546 [Aspergillus phoenicis ATCC 13157]|uniref:Uncharacterized protein n=1 Tax=Aspergillus phoenicis ATCC 13157 TaxID=1353007 RepID=A0A370P9P8_ASPPH|nr:hypothetical protein M752DRAFT_77546 [Aspergillus phoenicis ATCC 13157]
MCIHGKNEQDQDICCIRALSTCRDRIWFQVVLKRDALNMGMWSWRRRWRDGLNSVSGNSRV